MEKFVFATLKIFLWLILGTLTKLLCHKLNFNNLSSWLSKKFGSVLIYVIIPYFITILLWQQGLNFFYSKIIFFMFGIILIFGFFISKQISSFTGNNFSEIFFSLTFMNTLYLGLPVTEYFVSHDAVQFTILYSIIVTIIQFTFGIALLSPKYVTAFLTSPVIYGSILGLVLNKTDVYLWEGFVKIHSFIETIISPITLFFMGYSMPWNKFFQNIRLHITITLFLRIFAGLIISLLYCLVLKLFFVPNIQPNFVKTMVLISILPSAIINYILLDKLNINTEFVSGEILWGTVLVIFLLPYINELLDLFILILF
jgi:predicted permease